MLENSRIVSDHVINILKIFINFVWDKGIEQFFGVDFATGPKLGDPGLSLECITYIL